MTDTTTTKPVRRPIHEKVFGASIGALLSGLIVAELEQRLHIKLLPEEITAIGVVGTFIGGWLKRAR